MPQSPMAPMILPKGIVVNSADIYKEVANYPTVPPEKIWEYWHVYTTTFRKLIDPTAHRLENFWWHVWGSDRRFLSGATLAKIFEEISLGPTDVPLRGPPNRFDGPIMPRFEPSGSSSSNARQTAAPRKSRKEVNKESDFQCAEPPLKPLSSSSSKPPPPHPILKKSRGPSTSGPKPTARFISPHESADEGGGPTKGPDKAAEEPSTSSTASVGGSEMRAPKASPSASRPEKKKSTSTGGKKYVATTPASKRRPQIPRRQGSQSSTGSAETVVSKGSNSSPAGSKSTGSHRSITPIAEHAVGEGGCTSQGTAVSSPTEVLSAKAAGKRPAAARSAADKRQPPRQANHQRSPPAPECQATFRGEGGLPGAQSRSLDMKGKGKVPLLDNLTTRNQSARGLGRRPKSPHLAQGATPMVRSRSNVETRESSGAPSGQHPIQGLTSRTTATTSSVAAHGTIIDFEKPVIPELPQDDEAFPRRRDPPSILDSRYTPTAPNPTPTVPLGRTKSQLTLLLERENARLGKS